MEIRQLRYAVRLANYGRFTLAAQSCFVTQSAFSQQISQLERELGVQLFTRSSTGTVPTPVGERFLEHARSVLSNLALLKDDVAALADGYTGLLRLGMFGAGAGEFMPLLIDAFREAMPDVELGFQDLSMSRQFEELRSGEIDLAIVHPLCDSDDVVFTPLFDEPRFAAIPTRHELADTQIIAIADLVKYPFVRAGGSTPGPWREFWAYDSDTPQRHNRAEMNTISEGLAAEHYAVVPGAVPPKSAFCNSATPAQVPRRSSQ